MYLASYVFLFKAHTMERLNEYIKLISYMKINEISYTAENHINIDSYIQQIHIWLSVEY